MKAVTQHYIGSTKEWETANPKLYKAVWGFEVTADGKVLAKLGDGVNKWKTLKYFDAENIKGLSERLRELFQKMTDNTVSLEDETLARREADETLTESIKREAETRKHENEILSIAIIDEEEERKQQVADILEAIKTLAPEGLENIPALIKNEARERIEAIETETLARNNADIALQKNIDTEARSRRQAVNALQANINKEERQRQSADQNFQNELNAIVGNGGFLNAHDFGKALDANDSEDQLLLTDYSMSQIPAIDDHLLIWNGTRVTNLFNGDTWILSNTQDTDPPIFEWSNNGPSLIKPFSGNIGGFIAGADQETDGPEYVFALPNGKGRIDLDAVLEMVFLKAHPVGSIYLTVNPAESTAEMMNEKYPGSSWIAWGAGRVPVGIAASGTFDTIENTGGDETHTLTTSQMPSHNHPIGSQGAVPSMPSGIDLTSVNFLVDAAAAGLNRTRGIGRVSGSETSFSVSEPTSVANNGGGGSHNNLQPYIVCYMYKRLE